MHACAGLAIVVVRALHWRPPARTAPGQVGPVALQHCGDRCVAQGIPPPCGERIAHDLFRGAPLDRFARAAGCCSLGTADRGHSFRTPEWWGSMRGRDPRTGASSRSFGRILHTAPLERRARLRSPPALSDTCATGLPSVSSLGFALAPRAAFARYAPGCGGTTRLRAGCCCEPPYTPGDRKSLSLSPSGTGCREAAGRPRSPGMPCPCSC